MQLQVTVDVKSCKIIYLLFQIIVSFVSYLIMSNGCDYVCVLKNFVGGSFSELYIIIAVDVCLIQSSYWVLQFKTGPQKMPKTFC